MHPIQSPIFSSRSTTVICITLVLSVYSQSCGGCSGSSVVVLLASSNQEPSACTGAVCSRSVKRPGMRISTSKSKAMVLDQKRMACPLRVGGEVLPQMVEFKYLGVLFTSEGKMEREIDRRIGGASTVMQSVYRTVVVKKELSRKAKLSIYQ
ncbi:hypothetical protein L3Q82_021584, partial [Scortum barcoo]